MYLRRAEVRGTGPSSDKFCEDYWIIAALRLDGHFAPWTAFDEPGSA